MNREEALNLLDAYLDKYRKLSYDELAVKIGYEEFPKVIGGSGTKYQLEIQIRWDHEPGGDIRVMASIDDGTFRGAFKPVCSDLIVGADDRGLNNAS
jgi:hypothetical protein